jgi:hypothetical protein
MALVRRTGHCEENVTVTKHRNALATAAVAVLLAVAPGCAADATASGEQRAPIVYGSDGRLEYFQMHDVTARAGIAHSTAVLVLNRWLDREHARIAGDAPTLAAAERLCAGEPFAEQPKIAFCTAVLVDWDLVLTAGHCVGLHALDDFSVAFGYYYSAPGVLALAPEGIATPVEILHQTLSHDTDGTRLDLAWVRLAKPVANPFQPVPIYTEPPPVSVGDSLLTIGSSHGVPLKLDSGARLVDLRLDWLDYFVADTDTSTGWSGGGAFDEKLALIGILARGGEDLWTTSNDCQATTYAADSAAQEEFTYAHRAVDALCAIDASVSTICRADCSQPCQALPRESLPAAPDIGCTLAARHSARSRYALTLLLGFICSLSCRRNRWLPALRQRVRST